MIIFLFCGSGELQSWAADPGAPELINNAKLTTRRQLLDVEANPTLKASPKRATETDNGKRATSHKDGEDKAKRKGSQKTTRDRIVKSQSDSNTLTVKDKANPVQRSRSKESRKSDDVTTKKRSSRQDSSAEGYESLSESHV
jgi:hypothetical protein